MTSPKNLYLGLCPFCGKRVLLNANFVFGAKNVSCHWVCIKNHLEKEGSALPNECPNTINNSSDLKHFLENTLQVSLIMSLDKSYVEVTAMLKKYSDIFDLLHFNVETYKLVEETAQKFSVLHLL